MVTAQMGCPPRHAVMLAENPAAGAVIQARAGLARSLATVYCFIIASLLLGQCQGPQAESTCLTLVW